MRLKLYTFTKHEFDDKFSRHSLTFLRRNFQRIFKDYSRVENYLKLLIYLEPKPKPRLRNATRHPRHQDTSKSHGEEAIFNFLDSLLNHCDRARFPLNTAGGIITRRNSITISKGARGRQRCARKD